MKRQRHPDAPAPLPPPPLVGTLPSGSSHRGGETASDVLGRWSESGPLSAARRSSQRRDEVLDEQGRRRFHGAFTGGFSAGYYNTVGSKEGWAPSAFVSSSSAAARAPGGVADMLAGGAAGPPSLRDQMRQYMDAEDEQEELWAAASGSRGGGGSGRPRPAAAATAAAAAAAASMDGHGARKAALAQAAIAAWQNPPTPSIAGSSSAAAALRAPPPLLSEALLRELVVLRADSAGAGSVGDASSSDWGWHLMVLHGWVEGKSLGPRYKRKDLSIVSPASAAAGRTREGAAADVDGLYGPTMRALWQALDGNVGGTASRSGGISIVGGGGIGYVPPPTLAASLLADEGDGMGFGVGRRSDASKTLLHGNGDGDIDNDDDDDNDGEASDGREAAMRMKQRAIAMLGGRGAASSDSLAIESALRSQGRGDPARSASRGGRQRLAATAAGYGEDDEELEGFFGHQQGMAQSSSSGQGAGRHYEPMRLEDRPLAKAPLLIHDAAGSLRGHQRSSAAGSSGGGSGVSFVAATAATPSTQGSVQTIRDLLRLFPPPNPPARWVARHEPSPQEREEAALAMSLCAAAAPAAAASAVPSASTAAGGASSKAAPSTTVQPSKAPAPSSSPLPPAPEWFTSRFEKATTPVVAGAASAEGGELLSPGLHVLPRESPAPPAPSSSSSSSAKPPPPEELLPASFPAIGGRSRRTWEPFLPSRLLLKRWDVADKLSAAERTALEKRIADEDAKVSMSSRTAEGIDAVRKAAVSSGWSLPPDLPAAAARREAPLDSVASHDLTFAPLVCNIF